MDYQSAGLWEVVLSWRHEANTASLQSSSQETHHHQEIPVQGNWHDYNESLVQRGSITLWISEEDIGAWKPGGPRKRGGQFQYSDGAIQCLLMVRSVFHLTLRAKGFSGPCFTCWSGSCRCRTIPPSASAPSLAVSFSGNAPGPLHLVLDSTGLKVFGEGEWKVRQHGIYQTAHLEEAPSERGQ